MTALLLALIAGLLGLAGAVALSQATTGVGLIAIGCLFAIFARLSQASRYQEELMAEIEKLSEAAAPPGNSSDVNRSDR